MLPLSWSKYRLKGSDRVSLICEQAPKGKKRTSEAAELKEEEEEAEEGPSSKKVKSEEST